jgi:cytidine deaminase
MPASAAPRVRRGAKLVASPRVDADLGVTQDNARPLHHCEPGPQPARLVCVHLMSTSAPVFVSGDDCARLIAAARAAAEWAYCPYSRFRVGAAVLSDDGRVFSGCNVENASYGLTMCAERASVFQAVAHGATRLRAVVVYTPTDKPTAPCGACRQVLYEFGPDLDVICICDGPDQMRTTLADLLPGAFGPHNLES